MSNFVSNGPPLRRTYALGGEDPTIDVAREEMRAKVLAKDYYINDSNPEKIAGLQRPAASIGIPLPGETPGYKTIRLSRYLTRDEIDANNGLIVTYKSDGTRLINGAELMKVGDDEYYNDPSKVIVGGVSSRTNRMRSQSKRKHLRKGQGSHKRSARRTR